MTTNYLENIIELAKQGGYNNQRDGQAPYCYENEVLLDPLFWSSLGKSLGWEGKARECFAKGMATYEWEYQGAVGHYAWEYQWHRFIDSLAEGKSAESFFESLINVKG